MFGVLDIDICPLPQILLIGPIKCFPLHSYLPPSFTVMHSALHWAMWEYTHNMCIVHGWLLNLSRSLLLHRFPHLFIIIFCCVVYDLWNLLYELECVSTNKKTTPNTCMLSCLQKPHNAGPVQHWSCGMQSNMGKACKVMTGSDLARKWEITGGHLLLACIKL